jgi:hypothetical protein
VDARDTAPDARRVHTRALRRLGPAARVLLAFEMSDEARRIAAASLCRREPGLSVQQARARVLRRVLGDALADAAYGSTRA